MLLKQVSAFSMLAMLPQSNFHVKVRTNGQTVITTLKDPPVYCCNALELMYLDFHKNRSETCGAAKGLSTMGKPIIWDAFFCF